MKSQFMPRDKVYHYHYGWGEIMHKSKDFIRVLFNHGEEPFNAKANLLSFTEYTLQGFSQERPIELPKVGEVCLFYDYEEDLEVGDVYCGKFQAYRKNEKRPYRSNGNGHWTYCKRIKILD